MKRTSLLFFALLPLACIAQSNPFLANNGAGFYLGQTSPIPIPSGISAFVPAQTAYGFNINPLLMPHWTACTAKVKINTGNCRVLMVGDSTTYGLGSNGTLSTGDVTVGSYPANLAKYLNSSVLPAQRDAAIGAGGGTGNGNACGGNDARIACGGAWAFNGVTTAGGNTYNAGATGTLTFTPTDSVNTFVFWYIVNSGLGAGTYAVDGGSTTAFNENGGSAITSVTVNAGSLAAHTLDIAWTSGSIYLIGFEAYNSAVGSVRIENAGWSGSNSGNWNNFGSPWQPLNAVAGMAPDVILIDLGINDWNSGVTTATYAINIQALINAWKATSDIILVTPDPGAITVMPLATQQAFVSAMYQLAISNNLPLIDNFSRWGSYERANVAPLSFYFNNQHPDALGYSDFAQSVAEKLLTVVGH